MQYAFFNSLIKSFFLVKNNAEKIQNKVLQKWQGGSKFKEKKRLSFKTAVFFNSKYFIFPCLLHHLLYLTNLYLNFSNLKKGMNKLL